MATDGLRLLLQVLLTILFTSVYSEDVDCSRRQLFIDTDIGDFFDDSAAVAYSLKNSNYQVQFLLTATGDVLSRAKVAAKYLELAGFDHVPVGIGETGHKSTGTDALFSWAKDFNITGYKGGVYEKGIDEMASRILQSPCKEVYILEIAPAPNMMAMLQKYPDVAKKAQVKVTAGSIRRGYDNSSTPSAEHNVALCPDCMKALFNSGANVTMSPLDVSQFLRLSTGPIQSLLYHSYPVPNSLMHTWLYYCTVNYCHPNEATGIWFDVVASFLVGENPEELLQFEVLKITVTSDGHTVVDDKSGTSMYVATGWCPDKGGPDELAKLFTDIVTKSP
jgi:inosine-uridine nucleoside N-ribohydrolase